MDDVLKEAERADKKELAAPKDEAASLMKHLSNFRDLAGGKARRLAQSLAAGDQRRSITTVRQALVPAEHVTDVMQAMLVYFRSQLPATGGAVRNFRAVLYSEQADVMVPTHCLDLKQPGVGFPASVRPCRTPPSRSGWTAKSGRRTQFSVSGGARLLLSRIAPPRPSVASSSSSTTGRKATSSRCWQST